MAKHRQSVAKPGSDLEKPEAEDLNPRSNIPLSVQSYSKQEYFCELIGKLLWFDSAHDRDSSIIKPAIVLKYYEMIENAFPESARIALLRATYLMRQEEGESADVAERLEAVRKRRNSLSLRFSIYQRSKSQFLWSFYMYIFSPRVNCQKTRKQ